MPATPPVNRLGKSDGIASPTASTKKVTPVPRSLTFLYEPTAAGYSFSVSSPYSLASCICFVAYSFAPNALPTIAGSTSPPRDAMPRPPRIMDGKSADRPCAPPASGSAATASLGGVQAVAPAEAATASVGGVQAITNPYFLVYSIPSGPTSFCPDLSVAHLALKSVADIGLAAAVGAALGAGAAASGGRP